MKDKNYIIFSSPKPFLVFGIITAIISPILGLILGIYLWLKPQLKREGLIILLIVAIWLIIINIFVLLS